MTDVDYPTSTIPFAPPPALPLVRNAARAHVCDGEEGEWEEGGAMRALETIGFSLAVIAICVGTLLVLIGGTKYQHSDRKD